MNAYFISIFLTYTELVIRDYGKEMTVHTYMVGMTKTLWAVETGQENEKLVKQ